MANHTTNRTKSLPSKTNKGIEKMKTSFYNLTKLPSGSSEEVITSGYAIPIENHKFVIDFMKNWVAWKDTVLDKLEEGSKAYIKEFGKRGFTYKEFLLVLSGKVKEEHYKKHRVFQYLYLYDDVDINYFKSEFLDDETSKVDKYIEAISKWIKLEIPILHSFFFATKMPLYFPIKHLKKHFYLLAQSGSGKSELLKLLFYDLQRLSHKNNSKTLILIEPHGDMSQETLMFIMNKKNRERVVYLDPFIRDTAKSMLGEDILGEDYTFVLNPLELQRKSERDIDFMTSHLAKAFFEIIESQETFQMEAIIEACLEVLLRNDGFTIADLKRFMDDERNQDLIELASKIPNEERRNMLIEKFEKDGKIRTTKGSIYYRLQKLLGNTSFQRTLVGKSTFDLEREINSGKVIICNLAKGRMHSASNAVGKLIVALILGYVTKRQDIDKRLRKETFLIIDEFQNFVTPSIEDIMSETRKYALHVGLAHQVMGQNMSSQMKRVISGNTAFKIAGDNEPESISFMAKQMKGIDVEKFDELPDYSFFVSNKFNKKSGTFLFRVPDFLVKAKSPFYMSKKDLKEFFLYLVHESGYYKKVEPARVPVPMPKLDNQPSLKGRMDKAGIYKPDFKE